MNGKKKDKLACKRAECLYENGLWVSERKVGKYSFYERNEQWTKMKWKFYWLTKWNTMRLQRKWDEGFIDLRSMDAMETLASGRLATVGSYMHYHVFMHWCFISVVALIIFLWNKCGLWETLFAYGHLFFLLEPAKN